MTQFSADDIRRATLTPRWSALSQIGGLASDLVNFDPFLIREPRLLVPIDVQALVVRAGVNDGAGMLRIPFRDGHTPLPPVDLGDSGTPRPPGVHLLWSVPAAMTRGRIVPDPSAPDDQTKATLQLPRLPDRWVVLRLTVGQDAHDPTVTGWVIEADTGTATPLTDWPSGAAQSVASTPIDPTRIDAHAGGLGWLQSYDAAAGRCSFYDDLKDLEGASLVGDAVTYLVAGWWSASANDPLDGVGTDQGYRQRLSELGWNDPDHPSPDAEQRAQNDARYRIAKTFGLPLTDRYTQPIISSAKAPTGTTGSGYVAPTAQRFKPAYSAFVSESITAALLPPAPTRSTLLHGRIHGVPLGGPIAPDSAPSAEALRVVLGSSTPDVAAALTVAGADMGSGDQDTRRAAERLLVAFTSGKLMQAGSSDSWADVAEYEHAQAFVSQAGGIEAVDRYLDKPGPPSDPGAEGRASIRSQLVRGKGAQLGHGKAAQLAVDATVLWSATGRPAKLATSSLTARLRENFDGVYGAVKPLQPATIREVPRPAPSYRQPAAPVVAVAGAGRALSAVEREEADGALMCRLSDQTGRGLVGVLSSDELLDGLGTSAVPPEILDLAREALSEDPYLTGWRAVRASNNGFASGPATTRIRSEAALSFAYYGADDERLSKYVGTPVTSAGERQKAVEGLLRLSAHGGVWAHPEGVTMWGQPWRPLFCDWEVEVDLDPITAWNLDDVDLDLADGTTITAASTLTFTGRSPLQPAVAKTIASGIDRWLTEERQRDLGGHGLADPQTESALSTLRDALAGTDMMSVALDGIREQLMGLQYDRGLVRDDGTGSSTALAVATLYEAGRLRLTRARVVDAFGRFLELPVDSLLVPERIAEGTARDVLLRPRITAPARWRFDLVDATTTAPNAALARVDQPDPDKQVNPVAGFLLPDHMDESLEVFATDGTPLGELLHDGYSDAVTWEVAPGRTDVPPAAGPTDDPDQSRRLVGWIAAGVVGADAADRQGTPNRSETESSLSAMLRAIDTTLWTVDPFGSLGTEHIAGLVGRPIAVVRARLSLDVKSDANDVLYSSTASQTDRQAAYDALATHVFQVRLGEVTRTDDGLLGYFVDDDYTQFHIVDRSIADNALPSGRGRGALDPDTDPLTAMPITHKYVNNDGLISIRPGQTVLLTLLMHPGAKVHLTSGVLPRVDRALARDWVNPGLSVLAPSLRSGPLLIDVDKTRLPKVASFPVDQLFTHRDTPTTWRDNPILAATQSALLPDTQPEVREGWVRVSPNKPTQPGS